MVAHVVRFTRTLREKNQMKERVSDKERADAGDQIWPVHTSSFSDI